MKTPRSGRVAPKFVALALAALALCLPLALLSPVSAEPSTGPADPTVPGRPDDPTAHGQAAIDRLADRLPTVARAYGLSAVALRDLFLADHTLAVDNGDNLLYVDVLAPGETPKAPSESTDGETAVAAPPVTAAQFQLESLPGADKTIYLDFDGHVTTGTTWNTQNNRPTITTGPYDLDGDPNSWSLTELQRIEDSWAVAAEDFAPWNINVTTKEPPIDDLRRSGSGDTRWGARVVITPDDWKPCGCGGHAYIGSFDDSVDTPTFVYNSSFRGLSEAISHEVGHMMNLAHDGTTSGTAYYQGHQGVDEPSWAPIMGVAYYVEVGQWSSQEYTGANNNGSSANYGHGPDDVAIISSLTNGNGFGVRADDHGGVSNPTPLDGGTTTVAGVIETRSDVDAFSFTTTGGQVSLHAFGDLVGSNLDIELTLRDDIGVVVATANPMGALGTDLDVTVGAGTYTVTIDGVGVGNPFAPSPTGYTDYASLGRYTLDAVIDGVGPPDPPDPPDPSTQVTSGETPIHGTVTGDNTWTHTAGDGLSQAITETHSGGRPANRYDRAEHRWTVPAASGNQTLRVVAMVADGGDADAGFDIEWSTDGSTWWPVATVASTTFVDASVSIGGPDGPVQVRVIDTDRTPGQLGLDTVHIDLIEITGDGGPVDPPVASDAVASLSVGTQGAGKGTQYGTATVTVVDNLGNPVQGAEVEVHFSGTFEDQLTATTDSSGTASFRTSNSAKKPTVSACIAAVAYPDLTWVPGSGAC